MIETSSNTTPPSVAIDMDALRALPPRRPAEDAPRPSRIQWERIAPDRYRVMVCGETVGFIDVVGAVFVALRGDRYDQSTEVRQTLVWVSAIAALDPQPGRS